jgi:hypothetical protein
MNIEIFKKTDQDVVPSANKDPIPNPSEKVRRRRIPCLSRVFYQP